MEGRAHGALSTVSDEIKTAGPRYKLIGFSESTDGYVAHLQAQDPQVRLSRTVKSIALGDLIHQLPPYDAFQVGFWLGRESAG